MKRIGLKILFFAAMTLFACMAFSACSRENPSVEYDGAGDRVGLTSDMPAPPEYASAKNAAKAVGNTEFVDGIYENDQWKTSSWEGVYNYTSVILGDSGSYVVHLPENRPSDNSSTDSGIEIDNYENVITIKKAGYFRFIGSLTKGRIVADCDENVRIILDGVTMYGKNGAPVCFYGYGQKVLTFAEGTTNNLYAGERRTLANSERENPNCAVYSQSDLTINGSGSCTVTGYDDGAIICRSTLKIKTATIDIRSKNDAITAMNVVVKNGASLFSDSTAGCAIIARRTGRLTKEGFVVVSDATVRAVSAFDAIRATDLVCVKDSRASVTVCSGNGSSSELYDEIYSRKGIVCDGYVVVSDGTVCIDSLDDAISCKKETLLGGGFLTASTKSAAIDSCLTEIKGCRVEITKAKIGIKGCKVAFSDGSVKISANETAVNLGFANGDETECSFVMNGGKMDLFSCGTCIIVQGKMLVGGGSLWCDSSLAKEKPAISADQGFRVDGGRVFICAGAGMIQTPANQSEQDSVTISFLNYVSANTTVSIKYDDVVLFSREMVNRVGSLFFSCPNFSRNYACSLELNGRVVRKFTVSQKFSELGVA
ncbi:MAG: carbohydrate-binding domain-containing protein [Firmicutes bacterium]|nr:carbohydrate-binding domain-containing protein [Bacillota bacterium]MDY5531598.1 carbohydrate-binding domain-containing protein [Pumilibacteraceae bacterium]